MLEFGGNWSQKKLGVLAEYLEKYNTALKKQGFRRYYIDTFAGVGSHAIGREIDGEQGLLPIAEMEVGGRLILEGSARIALQTDPPFDDHVLSDLKKRNSARLEGLRADFPEKRIVVRHGDANAVLANLVKEINWRNSRAVVFLDPYGGQVKWATLEALANTGGVDLWYLFPSGLVVNRNIPVNGQIRTDISKLLTQMFGTASWQKEFLAPNREPDLFGRSESDLVRNISIAAVEKYLVKRLDTIFKQTVPKCLTLFSKQNVAMYSLCFAASNQKGAQIACRIAGALIEKMSRVR